MIRPDHNISTTDDQQRKPRGVRHAAPALETARERWMRWRRRGATVAAGVLACMMGYGVVFGHNGLIAYAHKREESRDLTKQVDVLQRENQRLEVHVERLQSDPDAIEHQAREELHYTRAGEVIYSLPDKEVAPQAAPQAAK
ncbi:cell division protein FtsB [Bryocella elongata]|uniref:Cell division protein FtsB n=1 Tax=Bryocella elongata TaxID=863522 RepID=A0A1H5UL72_9BACT|nr:septum formation initiator family protein [Bryocella elongata]SEF75007.1 cell division protein FtsB [Bryocella elongata]